MPEKDEREKIKQHRIMKYFIQSTIKIIQEENIGSVTIRKVANHAGYTSATLYNYFDNLSHLVFLANMTHLEDYNKKIFRCVSDCKNPIEVYMSVCKCFSVHAYENPEIFTHLFFSQEREKYDEYTDQYYELFPEKKDTVIPEVLEKMFHINNLYNRSFIMLKKCIDEDYIEEENAKDFNDICLRFNKTILDDVSNNLLAKDEALKLTLKYYYQLFTFFIKPEYKYILEEYYPKLISNNKKIAHFN